MDSLKNLKKLLVGTPIPSAEAHHQRLSKTRALATFSSDPLSSVAYATEEILLVLMLAGSAALYLAIPISLAIIGLLLIVVISYRQTIYAYPSGGGAYIVARENLGEMPGLAAAAALLTDYVLTVAVSVAAGIEALVSAFPRLAPHSQPICLAAIFILTVMNLRGLKESSTVFAIPTYAFVVGVFALLAVAAYKLSAGSFTHIDPPQLPVVHGLTLFLLLRAFSSGCTAMTGVEAVSNGIPVFKHPESRNAAITLMVMLCMLAVMFFGITFFAHYHGVVPNETETVLSQLTRSVVGTSPFYYYIQFTTMAILVLAANTSYADFPRLSSILAKDRYLPRQLMTQGDRLVFSNGVLALGLLASLLIVMFKASTHALIPLYAVGVFLSFTLSQAGMVRHWYLEKESGWIPKAVVNAVGCVLTGVVTVVFTVTKFVSGAWIITLAIPIIISIFRAINRHYLDVGKQLTLIGALPEHVGPKARHHVVILPMAGLHKGTIEALHYAQSISADVRAVYVEIDPAFTASLQENWLTWGEGVPLVVLKSPYRSILAPLLKYVDEVALAEQDEHVTVLVPEFVTARWWHNLLHNQTALLMRAALAFKEGVVVTSVRYHLR
ncbi:MAG: APC family permease [Deltaproteobacteria bacterium]|nr:APC family permease [Deltaproteobacteria bacterium]